MMADDVCCMLIARRLLFHFVRSASSAGLPNFLETSDKNGWRKDGEKVVLYSPICNRVSEKEGASPPNNPVGRFSISAGHDDGNITALCLGSNCFNLRSDPAYVLILLKKRYSTIQRELWRPFICWERNICRMSNILQSGILW